MSASEAPLGSPLSGPPISSPQPEPRSRGQVPSPPRSPLPPDGLTFEVSCRTSARDPGRQHPVTVTHDWHLITPHDLDAERVAVALGGLCSCVDLADRTFPAARGYVAHRLRLAPAAIVHAADGSWLPLLDAVGCCGDQGFPQARDAAAHLRRPKHWARRYGTTPEVVTELAQRLVDALAAEHADPAIAQLAFELRCPPVADADRPALVEPYGLVALWDAGLHPADVAALCRSASPCGAQLATADVLDLAYRARPAPEGHPAASDAPAPRTFRGHGRRRPDERRRWIAAGVPLAAVTAVLAGDAYALDDARILAARLSRSVGEAAGLLGRWQASGMTPPVDTLVGLYWGPMQLDAPPPADLIDRTLDLARAGGVESSRVDAALALVRTGTPAAAVAMLADPFRRPDDPYSR